jgi:hypothetical protein
MRVCMYVCVRVCVNGEGKRDGDDLEDGGSCPCRQMGRGRQRLRIEQRDGEQAKNKEEAYGVDLGVLAENVRMCVCSAAAYTTADFPAHQCSFLTSSECAVTKTDLPTNVSAASERDPFEHALLLLRHIILGRPLDEVARGSGCEQRLTPGPGGVDLAILVLE